MADGVSNENGYQKSRFGKVVLTLSKDGTKLDFTYKLDTDPDTQTFEFDGEQIVTNYEGQDFRLEGQCATDLIRAAKAIKVSDT